MTEKKEPARTPEKKVQGKLIHRQMIKVMQAIEAISKDRENQSQRYKFRGIDDVYNMIHGVFAKHGIITIPTVLAEKTDRLKTSGGKDMIGRVLKVAYRFVAEDGSFISAIVYGEGFDMGDKSTNKAMAAAHKYLLLQTFCIPTDEPKDSEEDSHEVKHNGSKEKARAAAKEKLKEAEEEKKKTTEKPPVKRDEKPSPRRSAAAASTDFEAPPPPKEYAGEGEFNPDAKPPTRFDTAVKMTVSGQVKNISYGEALQHFQKAKKFLGEEDYYHVLNGDQFEKSDQIPFERLDEMYKRMLERYNEKSAKRGKE